MTDRPKRALDDWLRMHRALMEQEKRFAALAQAYAAGTLGEEELMANHRMLTSMRELAEAVLAEALAYLRSHDRR